jgi:hypothetical protein
MVVDHLEQQVAVLIPLVIDGRDGALMRWAIAGGRCSWPVILTTPAGTIQAVGIGGTSRVHGQGTSIFLRKTMGPDAVGGEEPAATKALAPRRLVEAATHWAGVGASEALRRSNGPLRIG